MRMTMLFDEFLGRSVAEHKFSSSSFVLSPRDRGMQVASTDLVQRFEQLLGIPAQYNQFNCLSEQQFDQCLRIFLAEPELFADGANHVMLARHVSVTKWLIDGAPVPTGSSFSLFYGDHQCISTMLSFESLDHFRYIQRILEEMRFCRLNEKHLKAFKPPKRRKPETVGTKCPNINR
jgi:hypothetical protein